MAYHAERYGWTFYDLCWQPLTRLVWIDDDAQAGALISAEEQQAARARRDIARELAK